MHTKNVVPRYDISLYSLYSNKILELKGQSHEIFSLVSFHHIAAPGPIRDALGQYLSWYMMNVCISGQFFEELSLLELVADFICLATASPVYLTIQYSAYIVQTRCEVWSHFEKDADIKITHKIPKNPYYFHKNALRLVGEGLVYHKYGSRFGGC